MVQRSRKPDLLRHRAGIILQIGIHADDDIAGHGVQAGQECHLVAAVAGQLYAMATGVVARLDPASLQGCMWG